MKYLALSAYRGTIDHNAVGGLSDRREFTCAPGDVVDLTPALVTGLIADAPGLVDWDHPLTDDEAREAEAAKRQKEIAALDAADADRAKAAAVKAHTRAWGSPRCPGQPGQTYPAGWVPAEVGPHDAALVAALVDGQWFVGCQYHLSGLIAQGGMPTPPTLPDRTIRAYRVLQTYSATYTEYAPEGDLWRTVGPQDMPRRLSFTVGEQVDLAGSVAAWVERDAPGTLTRTDIEETTP